MVKTRGSCERAVRREDWGGFRTLIETSGNLVAACHQETYKGFDGFRAFAGFWNSLME